MPWCLAYSLACFLLLLAASDGWQVMDRIQSGVVVWKRVNMTPKNRYKKVENGNYVIDIAKVRVPPHLLRVP